MAEETSASNERSMQAPAGHAPLITPNDTTDLPYITRAIYVGGTGDVKLTTVGGETVTFASVPAGTVLPIRVARVLATGTTATAILGLY